jgi:hypothetical protein
MTDSGSTADSDGGRDYDEANNGDWQQWALDELRGKPSWENFESIMTSCIEVAWTRWRKRFSKVNWIRVMKRGRMLKELNEIAPVLDRVVREIGSPAYEGKRATVVDLCSGSGYFGMFIAELIPPEKLDRICLVDNAWPSYGKAPKAHHINHGHIVDTEWPTSVHCIKVDLKKPNHIKNLTKQVIDRAPGPIIMTAVHLCGVLSVRAVQIFNDNAKILMLTLKPCCLPPLHYITLNAPKSGLPIKEWLVAKRSGPAYAIPAAEVCSAGKWAKKMWVGPPRRHIRAKFEKWASHLMAAVDVGTGEEHVIEGLVVEGGGGNGRRLEQGTGSRVSLENIRVQQDHWQNLFIFAHRREGCARNTCLPCTTPAVRRTLQELRRQLQTLRIRNGALKADLKQPV